MIAAMTTERSDVPGRHLTRRTHDRVIGGVAGGLGDYFGIDPLLIRIGFAGLMIFGGAGLVLYVIAWLLLPAEGNNASILEDLFHRLGLTPRRMGWVVVIVVATVLVLSWRNYDGTLPGGIDPTAMLAVAVIIGGILLLRARGVGAAPVGAVAVGAQATVPIVAREAPAPRPRSPLVWYVFAAVLLATGLLAIISNVAGVNVAPGQFFGTALAVLAMGLVVGAWWGRARILILFGLLLMPLAVTASFVTAPLEGGIGDLRYAPANAAELRDEYRIMGVRLTLDLSRLSVGPQPIHIAASVAVGQLVIILPDRASVELDTRVGAGGTWVFSAGQAGTSLVDRYVRRHAHLPTFVLDLEAGIGEVDVYGAPRGGG